jgi:subtilase family serine protease
MRILRWLAPVATIAALLLVVAQSGSAAPGNGRSQRVCSSPANETAECTALVVTDEKGSPNATTAPTGLSPQQFHSAYQLPTSAPNAQTIAIVDAYDDPTAESDLAKYSTQFGLPACTTANGCFKKMGQNGNSSLPRADSGWALEISLDVQVAHGICQSCKILLVEARSSRFSDLATAEDTAASHGATVISNSYGGSEFSSETASDSAFNHPGIPITVSSGDSGFGVEYPAASRYVTAVGGTTLSLDSAGNRVAETAWSGAGSGCSAYEPKPSWQHDTACSRRTVADVSADADPASGASIYDSTAYQGQKGWFRVGGTSLAAPLVAAVYALAGNGSSTSYGSFPYAHTSSLFDVTSGSNGSCGGSYLCTALAGFDGPTGLGSPKGTGGF